MISWGGCHVTQEFGAPTIRDISVQLARIPRFGGAGKHYWPVGLHSMFVADLLPSRLEVHALLHDAAECIVGEVPRPMKTDQARVVEGEVMFRIYRALGIPLCTMREHDEIKVADEAACRVEGVIIGPRGFKETQAPFILDERALEILHNYLETVWNGPLVYSYFPNHMGQFEEDGCWPLEFEKRLRRAIRTLRGGVSIEAKAVA